MNETETQELKERIKQLESRMHGYGWTTVIAVAILAITFIRGQSKPPTQPKTEITSEQKAESVMLDEQIAGYRTLINRVLSESKFLTPNVVTELLDSTPPPNVEKSAETALRPIESEFLEELQQKRLLARALAPKARLAAAQQYVSQMNAPVIQDYWDRQAQITRSMAPLSARDMLEMAYQITPPAVAMDPSKELMDAARTTP